MTKRVMKIFVLGSLLALPASGPAKAQIVPDGIHEHVRGPVELCGLTGRDVRDLVERARASPAWRLTPIDTARFELFVAVDGMDQLVVTRPSEPAHPAATCRHVFQDTAGNWLQERGMRCEASREDCDRLFIEFQELDERMRQSLSGNR